MTLKQRPTFGTWWSATKAANELFWSDYCCGQLELISFQ